MLFSGITTLKKKTPRADQWVLSIAVMCALDEAESLEAFHTTRNLQGKVGRAFLTPPPPPPLSLSLSLYTSFRS